MKITERKGNTSFVCKKYFLFIHIILLNMEALISYPLVLGRDEGLRKQNALHFFRVYYGYHISRPVGKLESWRTSAYEARRLWLAATRFSNDCHNMIILKIDAVESDRVELLFLWACLACCWMITDTKPVAFLYHVDNFTPTGKRAFLQCLLGTSY